MHFSLSFKWTCSPWQKEKKKMFRLNNGKNRRKGSRQPRKLNYVQVWKNQGSKKSLARKVVITFMLMWTFLCYFLLVCFLWRFYYDINFTASCKQISRNRGRVGWRRIFCTWKGERDKSINLKRASSLRKFSREIKLKQLSCSPLSWCSITLQILQTPTL